MAAGKRRRILSQLLASVLISAFYPMQNFPIMFINAMLAPFSFLLVITFISHGTLLGVAIIGALVMTTVSAGMALQADLSHFKNDMRMQDMVVSSPTSASVYITGMGLSELIYFLPNIIILVILAALFIPNLTLTAALTITAVMAIMFVFSVVLSFLLSTLTVDIIQSWAFTNMVSTLLSTLPPVYYPITYIPLPWRYLAYLSPTTYAAQIAQAAAGYLPLSSGNLLADWAVLIVVSIAMLVIGIKKTRWREP